MRARRPAAAAGGAALLLLVTGCSLLGTARSGRGASVRSGPVQVAERTHEYPAPAPPAETAPGRPTIQDAVTAFATAYINWTAGSVAGDLRLLAELSVGQARSAMQLEAAETAGDAQLRQGGIANHGTVEAVAPVRGSPDQFAVVTRETTTASATDAYQGLAPAWHITIATVRHVGNGWVICGWQPEN